MMLELTEGEAAFLADLVRKPHILQCDPSDPPGCDKPHLIFTDASWDLTPDELTTYHALCQKFGKPIKASEP